MVRNREDWVEGTFDNIPRLFSKRLASVKMHGSVSFPSSCSELRCRRLRTEHSAWRMSDRVNSETTLDLVFIQF